MEIAIVALAILLFAVLLIHYREREENAKERAYLLNRIQNPELAARTSIVAEPEREPADNTEAEEEARGLALVGSIIPEETK
jgi:hypothetical protein